MTAEPQSPAVLPPPTERIEALRWLRQNLFSSWYSALLTLVAIWLIYSIAVPTLQWVFTEARWGVISANFHDELARRHYAARRYEQAILPADRLNGSRHQRLEPVSFSAIFFSRLPICCWQPVNSRSTACNFFSLLQPST